jgi:hypothetical protein
MDPVTGDGVESPDGLTGDTIDVNRAVMVSSFLGMCRELLALHASSLGVARDKLAAHNSSFAVNRDNILSLSDLGVPGDVTADLCFAHQVAHDADTALCSALGLAHDASATLASAFGVAHDSLSSTLDVAYDPSATLVSAFGADHDAIAAISSALGLTHLSSDAETRDVTGDGVEAPDGLTGDAIDVTRFDAVELSSFLVSSRDAAASASYHIGVTRDDIRSFLGSDFAATSTVIPSLSDLGVTCDVTAALGSALDVSHVAHAGLISALDVSHNAANALSSAFGVAHDAFVSAFLVTLADLVPALGVAHAALVAPLSVSHDSTAALSASHDATAALGASHDVTHFSTGGLPSPVSELSAK